MWLFLINASGRRASSQGEKLLQKKKSWQQNNWQGINLGWIVNFSSFRAADPLGSQVRRLHLAQALPWSEWLWNSHFYRKKLLPQRTTSSPKASVQAFRDMPLHHAISKIMKMHFCVWNMMIESAVQEIPLHWTLLHGLAAKMHFVLIQIHSPVWSGFRCLYQPFCKKIKMHMVPFYPLPQGLEVFN